MIAQIFSCLLLLMYVLILLYLTLKNNNESNQALRNSVVTHKSGTALHNVVTAQPHNGVTAKPHDSVTAKPHNVVPIAGATASRVSGPHNATAKPHNGVTTAPSATQHKKIPPVHDVTNHQVAPRVIQYTPSVQKSQVTETSVITPIPPAVPQSSTRARTDYKKFKTRRTAAAQPSDNPVSASSGNQPVSETKENPTAQPPSAAHASATPGDKPPAEVPAPSGNKESDNKAQDPQQPPAPLSDANTTTKEMDDFFKGYPSPPFSRKVRQDANDIQLVRQDFVDNVLKLTQTSANLIADVQKTIKDENGEVFGLGWFGPMGTKTIEDLLRNINMYRKFVSKNNWWTIDPWDPNGYKDTLEREISDIIIESRTPEMWKRQFKIDINIFPTFQDWEDYKEDKKPFLREREKLLNLIYQFSDDFQQTLSKQILTVEQVKKILHVNFSKYFLHLGEYEANEDITVKINNAIENENIQAFGLKWFQSQEAHSISDLYGDIYKYDVWFSPDSNKEVIHSYDPINHYKAISDRVNEILGELRAFQDKYRPFIGLPDIGNPTHIEEINRLISQHKKCVKILNKHVFYMELIMLLLGQVFESNYTGICFTKEEDRTRHYASLNGKLHDIGTLDKIIEIFYKHSNGWSIYISKRKWFKEKFLNISKNQTWDGFIKEFRENITKNIAYPFLARGAFEKLGVVKSDPPKYDEVFLNVAQDFTCSTIGS